MRPMMMAARWTDSKALVKVGMALALSACAGRAVDCSNASCAAGGVTVDFESFAATTPAAGSASVVLCVLGVKPAVCSQPRPFSDGKKGLLSVPLRLPESARLSVEVRSGDRLLVQALTKQVRLQSGPCCPRRATLTIDGKGRPKLDDRLAVYR